MPSEDVIDIHSKRQERILNSVDKVTVHGKLGSDMGDVMLAAFHISMTGLTVAIKDANGVDVWMIPHPKKEESSGN